MSNKRTARGRRPPVRRGSSSATRWVWIGAGVVVIAAGVLAVALSRGGSEDTAEGEVGSPVAIEGAALVPYASGSADASVGQEAPVIDGVGFDGEPVSIGGPGPQILVFLAHWCPHCQAEVPELVEAGNSADWPDNVEVVGIATATLERPENYPPSEWLERENWQWEVLADDEDTAAASAYGLSGFPFTVFVDADGNVALRLSGELQGGAPSWLQLADTLSKGEPLAEPQTGESSDA